MSNTFEKIMESRGNLTPAENSVNGRTGSNTFENIRLRRSSPIGASIADLRTMGDVSQFMPPVPDVGEGNTFANSPEFKDLISRATQDPDGLTDAEKKQVKAGREHFSVIDQFMKQSESRPDPEKQKIFDGFEKVVDNSIKDSGRILASDVFKTTPGLGPFFASMKAVRKAIGFLKGELQKRPKTDSPADLQRFNNLFPGKDPNSIDHAMSQKLSQFFDDEGLGSLGKDVVESIRSGSPVVVPIGLGGASVDISPLAKKLPKTTVTAMNLIVGGIRLVPELMAGFADNPAEFMLGLAEFPIEASSTIISAGLGVDIEGNLLTEKAIEEAQDELMRNPIQVPMLGLMAFGFASKIGKAGKVPETATIPVERARVTELIKERDGFFKDLEIANKKLEKANELEAVRTKKEKVSIPEESTGELQRIQETSTGSLMTEVLDLQKGAKEPLTAPQIARMSRNQLENIVSGDRIPLEKVSEAPKAPEVKQAEQIIEGKKPVSEKSSPPKPEESVAKQPEPAPITKAELQKSTGEIQTKIETAKSDIGQFENTISQFEDAGVGLKGSQKKNIEAAIASQNKNIAERRATVAQLEENLTELEARPVKEAEQTSIGFDKAEKRAEPAKPAVEPKPSGGVKVDKPPIVRTGNTEADVARNLAHTKRFVKSLEERIGEKESTPEQRQQFTEQLKEAKTDEAKQQSEFDRIRDEAEKKAVEDVKPAEKVAETPPDLGIRVEKTKNIKTDPERFQNRQTEFSEESVQRIVDDFDQAKLDPITIFKDPKTGDQIILSGHSRFEALKRLGKEDIPVRDFKGSEAEAVQFAKVEANRLQTKETLKEDVRAFTASKDGGSTQKQLKNTFGQENIGKLEAYSHLDPKGKLLDLLDQGIFDDHPFLKARARSIGELRKRFPELTNTHEKQIFDQLYPADKATGLAKQMGNGVLEAVVENQVGDALFTKDQPIKLKKDFKPQVGTRAGANTGAIVRKIDELKDLQEKNAKRITDPVALQKVNADLSNQITSLQAGVKDIVERQTGLELGAMGTPDSYLALARTVYTGLEGVKNYADIVIEKAKRPPELNANEFDFRDAMAEHRKAILDGENQRFILTEEFKRLLPDESRWDSFVNAWQQGPRSKWWDQLSNFEKGQAEYLRLESAKWEKFAIENDLIQKPADRPAGQVHVFQHWLNPKTGKPFPSTFGRLSKSGPQLLERKHQTFESGEAVGLQRATRNPGTLLGHTISTLTKAHASRQLYAHLNNIPFSSEFKITVKGKTRDMMQIESWKDLKEAGLTDGYVRFDDPFLDRPLRYKTKSGETRIIDGPVGVREEVSPLWDSYRNNPTFNKLDKLMQASKSIVLSGLFHPTQLAIQQLATGRIPFTGIKKGLDAIKVQDELSQGLIRNGLDVRGFREMNVDLKETLKIDSDKLIAKIANNTVLFLPRQTARLTFDVIHPGMKMTFARDNFNRILPEFERRGIGREEAYREAVKQSDNLFSGEDYKLAMLESSKAGFNIYYSLTARKFWSRTLLSPTWQKSHISAFIESGKAFSPEVLKNLTPESLQRQVNAEVNTAAASQYRRYVAGAAVLYTSANAYNYATTKSMDGEGKFMFQNPDGFGFKVRLRYNNPDGSAAYAKPFKSIFEVPQAIANVATGDFQKFTGKLAPIWNQSIQLFFNLNEFGQTRTDDAGTPERLLDFGLGLSTPIFVSQIFQNMRNNKAPIGIALSNAGFPVSKGPQGGEWGQKIQQFNKGRYKDKADAKRVARDMLIDGDVTGALNTMDIAGFGNQAMANLLARQQNALLAKWDALGGLNQTMFLLGLDEKEREKFRNTLRRSGKIE